MKYEVEFVIDSNFVYTVDAESEAMAEKEAEAKFRKELSVMGPADFDYDCIAISEVK